jgi:hypothetical protein
MSGSALLIVVQSDSDHKLFTADCDVMRQRLF